MPILPFLPAIIGAVSGIAGGILNNRKSARTTESSFSREGTSTTEGHLSKPQQRLNRAAILQLLEMIKAGPNVTQADKNMAYGDINRTWGAQIPRLRAMATAHGNTGGSLGNLTLQNEVGRSNARQQATGQLQHEAMQRYLQTLFGAKSFITPYSSTTTSSESGTGTNVGPSTLGNTVAGAGNQFANFLDQFQTAQWLKGILGGGGGSPDLFGEGGLSDLAP